MKPYKDTTMERAYGRVNSEWKYMVRQAIRIREGKYSSQEEAERRKQFTGIYKRLLTDPLAELYQERDGRLPFAEYTN